MTKSNLFWLVLFLVSVGCMWLVQREVPIMMDDEWYSTVLFAEEPLHSLGDVVQAQLWHYNHWGGRTVAHTIAQCLFLWLSEPVADALNVFLIVLLAWMINVMMGEKRLAFVTLTVGFLHGLNANWKMSMYWQTGACNYLYTTIIILAFLWMYLLELEKEASLSPAAVVAAPILGLLAGWTNENMGPAVWVLTIFIMCLIKRSGRRVRLWLPLGSAACLAGSLLMILAPGNGVRSSEVASKEYGVLWQIFLRMYGICKGVWEYLFVVILLVAVVMVVNGCVLGNHLTQRDWILLTGAVLSWGAMILSPHYPDRAAFGTMCFLFCVLSSQAGEILKSQRSKNFEKRLPILMSAVGVFVWLKGMYCLGEFLAISWGWIR